MGTNIRKSNLVFPELSYKIFGVLFAVWSDLGFGYQEKIYQRAACNAFRDAGLKVEEQLPAKIVYQHKDVGIYYFDFLIQDSVVVELKVRNYFSKKDIDQIYGYLKAKKLKLGILAHFTRTGAKCKRIINVV